MGLFSRLMGKKNGQPEVEQGAIDLSSSVQGAVLSVVVSAMVGDGEVNDAELVQLANICTLSPIFWEHSAEKINDMAKAIIDAIGARGHEAVIQEAKQSLSPELCETAFAFAARMIVADGVINESEVQAINAIGGWLGVEVETGKKILEVVLIMQRPPTA